MPVLCSFLPERYLHPDQPSYDVPGSCLSLTITQRTTHDTGCACAGRAPRAHVACLEQGAATRTSGIGGGGGGAKHRQQKQGLAGPHDVRASHVARHSKLVRIMNKQTAPALRPAALCRRSSHVVGTRRAKQAGRSQTAMGYIPLDLDSMEQLARRV